MLNTRLILVAAIALSPASALAHGPEAHPADPNLNVDPKLEDCSVQFSPDLTQADFGRFVREFGSIGAFKLMAPPQTLGQWGVAVGLEYMAFTVEEESDAWNETFHHPDGYHELGSDLAYPKLRARVGVTEDLDVGVFFTKQPIANYGWLGFEAKYGLLKQDERMPISLALRAAYTKTLFVDDMNMHAVTADVSVGRTFWNVLTPYVALGHDVVFATETSDAVDLEAELQLVPHAVGGVEVQLWHVALGAEAQLATIPTMQAQLSAVF